MYSEKFGFLNVALYSMGLIDRYIDFLGLGDFGLIGIAIAYAWHLAPLGAFFILSTLMVIPESLYHLAKIDGAGVLKRFVHVTFHSIKIPLAVTVVIYTIFSLTTVDPFIIMTGGGPGSATTTATYLIYKTLYINMKLPEASALSYILLAIIFIFSTFYFTMWKKELGV
jgi:ABC-type sugar transport system permease subunit